MSVRFIKHGQKVANQILKLIAREPSEFKNKTVVVKTSIAKQGRAFCPPRTNLVSNH